MKRFVIIPKRKGPYIIPVIETRSFNYPKRCGSYCAEDGSLWTYDATFDNGKTIFKSEDAAKAKLAEIIHTLFKETP